MISAMLLNLRKKSAWFLKRHTLSFCKQNSLRLFPLKFRKTIRIFREGGLGDCIAITPLTSLIKHTHPNAKIEFYSTCPDWFHGASTIDRACHLDSFENLSFWRKAFTLKPAYEQYLPLTKHISQVYADSIHLVGALPPPELADPGEESVGRFYDGLGDKSRQNGRPIICLSTATSKWTPNKAWPRERWEALVSSLLEFATVVEVGLPDDGPLRIDHAFYFDRTGALTPSQMSATFKAATLVVTPITSFVHIAAAMRTQAIVLVSGYEGPGIAVYADQHYLFSKTNCSPCWLRTPCPKSLECMNGISVESVLEKTKMLLQPILH